MLTQAKKCESYQHSIQEQPSNAEKTKTQDTEKRCQAAALRIPARCLILIAISLTESCETSLGNALCWLLLRI